MSVAELWANLVQAHAGLNWMALLPFYGILAMAGLFAALMIRLVRRAGRASEAAGRVRALEQEIKQLRSLESQTRQLRSDTGALQAQLDKGYQSLREHMATQKQALKNEIQELERDVRRELEEVERTVTREFEDVTTRATRRMEKLEQDGNEVLRQMESNNSRIAEVEKRIPDIYEHLEDFRTTLGNIFQNQLSAVLNSFDSSVAAVLDHMKGELEMGINRIEGIENMVHSRQRAERTLLGGGNHQDEDQQEVEGQRPLLEGLAEEAAFEEQTLEDEPAEPTEFAGAEALQQEEPQAEAEVPEWEETEPTEPVEEPIEEEPFEIHLEEESLAEGEFPEVPEPPAEEEPLAEAEEEEPDIGEPLETFAEDEPTGGDDEDLSAAA